MYNYQLSPTVQLTNEKMILAANMWKNVDDEYIVLMIHPDDEYTMESGHFPSDNSYERLLDEHFESIKKWYNETKKILSI